MKRFCFTLSAVLMCITSSAVADDAPGDALSRIACWSNAQTGQEMACSASNMKTLVDDLRSSAEGSELRINATAVARDFLIRANAVDFDPATARQSKSVAWTILVGSGVLRDGMTAEQIVAIVGSPSRKNARGDLVWTAKGDGAGPRLTAHVDDTGRSIAFVSDFGL